MALHKRNIFLNRLNCTSSDRVLNYFFSDVLILGNNIKKSEKQINNKSCSQNSKQIESPHWFQKCHQKRHEITKDLAKTTKHA